MGRELIREWSKGPFSLSLYDTFGFEEWSGKSRLAYEFKHDGETIFEGEDFFPSPLHAIDGDETVGTLLSFLSLRPGDTDPDYFADYTPEQTAWMEQHAEELSLIAYELEGGS